MLRVAVYSPEPDLLKPLLTGNPLVQATFDLPAKYDPQAAADIVVFDRFAPKDTPTNVASVWIEPPAGSPFAMRSPATKTKLDRWHQDTALPLQTQFDLPDWGPWSRKDEAKCKVFDDQFFQVL